MVRPIGKCTVDNQTRCDVAIIEFGSLWSEAIVCIKFPPNWELSSPTRRMATHVPITWETKLDYIGSFTMLYFHIIMALTTKRLLGAEPEDLWRYTKDWRIAFVLKVGCGHVSMKVMPHDAHERRRWELNPTPHPPSQWLKDCVKE